RLEVERFVQGAVATKSEFMYCSMHDQALHELRELGPLFEGLGQLATFPCETSLYLLHLLAERVRLHLRVLPVGFGNLSSSGLYPFTRFTNSSLSTFQYRL